MKPDVNSIISRLEQENKELEAEEETDRQSARVQCYSCEDNVRLEAAHPVKVVGATVLSTYFCNDCYSNLN